MAMIIIQKGVRSMTKCDNDNHSNQCNPNNDAYWESRGCDERPDEWEDQTEDE